MGYRWSKLMLHTTVSMMSRFWFCLCIPNLLIPTPKGMREAIHKSEEKLAALSSNSTKALAKNSRHYIYVDGPDAVIDAIRSAPAAAGDDEPLNRSLPHDSNSLDELFHLCRRPVPAVSMEFREPPG
jgi:hypothetical protein